MTINRRICSIILLCILLLQPAYVFADPPDPNPNPPATGTGGTGTTGTSGSGPGASGGGTAGTGTGGGTGGNSSATNRTLQQYNPNASVQSGNGRTYGGISFSGVGGALASCLNVGQRITTGISSLKSLGSSSDSSSTSSQPGNTGGAADSEAGGSSSVPTSDSGANKKLEGANDKLQSANQRENCLNGVAYAVAKSLLQSVVNKALSWVNTGLNGNPFYVRNIDSYLSSIGNEETRKFLDSIGNDEPIFGNAIRSIITENVTGIADGYLDKAMDTPEGRAYQDFQDDFTNGGWAAFLNPDNNSIDAVLRNADKLDKNISTQQGNAQNELQRNQGFLDGQKCVQYAAAKAPSASADDDSFYQGVLSEDRKCLKWETVTPGSVIANQVNEVTTTNIRQLEQADQINEVLGAFFDNFLNKLISDGLASLQGDNGFDFSGFGGFGSNSGGSASAGGASILGYQQSGGGFVANDFDISRPQHLRAVLQAQYDYLNRMRDSRAVLRRIVPTLGVLDYCIPGPNPTWNDGLEDNATTFFGSLQVVTDGQGFLQRFFLAVSKGAQFFHSLVGDPAPDTLGSGGVLLYDKVTDGPQPARAIIVHADRRATNVLLQNTVSRYQELVDDYKKVFAPDTIAQAFVIADPANNEAYVRGQVGDALEETAKLSSYNRAAAEIEGTYDETDKSTTDAIREMESIRQEVNSLVATAKARYIADMKAAGTPVDIQCLDAAYVIDTSPIKPVDRKETDAQSPFYSGYIDAGNYFYNNL